MPMDVAQLSVVIKGDTQDAEKKIGDVNTKVKDSGGFFKDALKNALGFASGAAIVGGVGTAIGFVTSNLNDMVTQGIEGNQIAAQLAAGLKATGGASGQTAQSLDALSNKIMNLTGIDDDAVKSAESMLLTFTNISGKTFPAATQAVADLATKMANGAVPSAQQMEQASIQLGKALNDPLHGYTALQRVGVSFTEQQKEQIAHFMKIGDVAGAQNVILKEMNHEFGGAAEAAGQANGGLAILTAQFDNMKQTVGQAILPILTQLLTTLHPLIASFGDALPGALHTLGTILGPIFDMIKWVGQEFLTHLQPGLKAVTDAFGGLGKQFSGIAWSDVLEPVGTLAGTLGGALSNGLKIVADLIKKIDWLAVGTAVGNFAAAINNALTQVGKFINFVQTHQEALDALEAIIIGIGAAVLASLIPAAIALVPAFIGWAVAAGAAAIATIAATWPLLAIGAGVALLILGVKLLISHWGDIQQFFSGIGQAVADAVGKVLAWFGQLKDKAIALVQNAFNLIKTTIENDLNAAKQIVQNIINGVINIFKWLYEHNTYFKAMVDAIKTDIKVAHDVIMNIVNGIKTFISNAFAAIKAGAENDWKLIQQFIIQPIQHAVAMIQERIDWARNWLNAQWAAIQVRVDAAWRQFTNSIGNALGTVKTNISNIVNAIMGPINDIGGKLFDAGKNLIQMLIDGINNMAGAVGQAAKNIADNIAKFLGFHSPAKEGPGSEADQWMPNLGNLLGDSLTSQQDKVRKAAHGVALAVASQLASGGTLGISVAGSGSGGGGGGGSNLMRAPASASASSGGGGNGGSGQPVVFEVDGYQFARAVLPHMVDAIRNATGIRTL